MKSLLILVYVGILVSFTACNKIKSGAKSTITAAGETVGETATTFVDAVTEGVEKGISLDIILDPKFHEKGLSTGAYQVSSTENATKNILSLYCIFNKNFSDTLRVKTFNQEGQETGRTSAFVEGTKGNASYFDFVFHNKTIIETKSKIIIE